MIILAHRAQDAKEPIPDHFGVEIDVRDGNGFACLSHDPVVAFMEGGIDEAYLDRWMKRDVKAFYGRPCYALNVKADGLEKQIKRAAHPLLGAQHWFVFDCSYPSQRVFSALNVPVAERVSEEEPWRGHSHLIWLDRWEWQEDDAIKPIKTHLPLTHEGKKVEVYAVSGELHQKNAPMSWIQHHWRRFYRMGVAGICTDHWMECEKFIQQLDREKKEGKPI